MPVSRVELNYLSIDNHGFDIDLDKAVGLLDEGEKARYHKFKNKHAQKCYLQARRIAKSELAKKLHCQPDQVRFSYSAKEKPYLDDPRGWHFNISHSLSSIVIAVSEALVGVDVEDIDRCVKICHRAEDFLNPYVKRCVADADCEYGAAAIFAEHWSCTESYVKLKGSTIYRAKDRVRAQWQSNFSGGKRFTFEDIFFTVFDFSQVARICVAMEGAFPEVELRYWRTGNYKRYLPEGVVAT